MNSHPLGYIFSLVLGYSAVVGIVVLVLLLILALLLLLVPPALDCMLMIF